jgi:hypothetical protein
VKASGMGGAMSATAWTGAVVGAEALEASVMMEGAVAVLGEPLTSSCEGRSAIP